MKFGFHPILLFLSFCLLSLLFRQLLSSNILTTHKIKSIGAPNSFFLSFIIFNTIHTTHNIHRLEGKGIFWYIDEIVYELIFRNHRLYRGSFMWLGERDPQTQGATRYNFFRKISNVLFSSEMRYP